MVNALELFGPPGVGKSAVSEAIDGRRVSDRRVIAVHRLLRVPRIQGFEAVVRNIPYPTGLIGRVALRLLSRDLGARGRRALLEDRSARWSELFAILASSPLERESPPHHRLATDPIRVLEVPGWVLSSLEQRALAETSPHGLIPVVSEGLVQRTTIVCGRDPEDAQLRRYVDALPPAGLYVRLHAPIETLVARLRERDRIIYRHAGLDPSQLEEAVAEDDRLFERCEAALRSSGARVVSVATDRPLVEVVADILAALADDRR